MTARKKAAAATQPTGVETWTQLKTELQKWGEANNYTPQEVLQIMSLGIHNLRTSFALEAKRVGRLQGK